MYICIFSRWQQEHIKCPNKSSFNKFIFQNVHGLLIGSFKQSVSMTLKKFIVQTVHGLLIGWGLTF